MKKITEETIIAFFEGELSPKEVTELTKSRAKSAEIEALFQEYQLLYKDLGTQEIEIPSEVVQRNFDQLLAREKEQIATKNPAKTAIIRSIKPFYRYAAAVAILIFTGLGIGIMVSNYLTMQSMNQELVMLKSEMNNLLNDESVSVRIKAVNMSFDLEKPDEDVVRALLKTMKMDASETVRAAAITALGKFAHLEKVKLELIKTLEEQQNPYIQIKIINILSTIKAKDAIPSFDRLIDDADTPRYVRSEAEKGKEKVLSI